jgi:hypothetical protein
MRSRRLAPIPPRLLIGHARDQRIHGLQKLKIRSNQCSEKRDVRLCDCCARL